METLDHKEKPGHKEIRDRPDREGRLDWRELKGRKVIKAIPDLKGLREQKVILALSDQEDRLD